jgi:predicted nucleic acid-binding protein
MPGFVIDASVATEIFMPDEPSSRTQIRLDLLAQTGASAPALWLWETGNALVIVERKGRLTREGRLAILADLQLWPVEIDPAERATIWGKVIQLAQSHELTVYDASYLELSIRKGLPLATNDQELRIAAEREAVPLL